MKVRCPICNGTGGVEPRFGSGSCDTPTYTSTASSKICPGCGGTGMQETYNDPGQQQYQRNKWWVEL